MGGWARGDERNSGRAPAWVGGAGLRAALALAWLAGVGVQLQQAALPVPAVHAVAALAAAAGVVLAGLWRGPDVVRAGVAIVALALAGWSSTGWRAQERLSQALPPDLVGRTLWVQGVVDSLPQADADATRFVFRVHAARDAQTQAPVAVPPRLWLAWHRGGPQAGGDELTELLAGPGTDLRAGQGWVLPLRLRPPWAPMNPHAPDTELRWFEQGLRALGHVRAREAEPARREPELDEPSVDALRQDLRDRLLRAVGDPRAAGVLAALAVGDQAAIAPQDWALFRDTGVAHLMSISGLHVTMFAWGAGLVALWAWRTHPRLMLAWPAARAAPWFGLAAAAAYAVLAGWGVPAQRTVWMLATVVLLRAGGLQWPAPLVLLAAAMVVTVADPWALAQPGFWLSFVAVAVLITQPAAAGRAPGAAVGEADAPPPWWRRLPGRAAAALWALCRTQWRVTLGLLPFSLLFFQQVSLSGLLANLVAVPVVTALVTPLALAGLLWAPAAGLAAWVLQPLLAALEWLAAWPGAAWWAAAPPPLAWAAAVVGAGLLMLPLPRAWRACGLVAMLPLLWPPVPRPPVGQFSLLAADVGQGTAVLVRTASHTLVFDTGPAYGRESDAGQRIVLPLLRALGERRADTLVLSHSDTDHVGGAAALLSQWPVVRMLSSLPAGHALRQLPVPHEVCAAGQGWAWDGVRFRVLHPEPGAVDAAGPRVRPNTLSCVLQVEDAQGRRALLTGDIERLQELALVDAHGAAGLRSDIVLVPHHGSRTSSSAPFVAAVGPAIAVVQAGYLSRFGHPAPDVVQRWHDAQAKLVRTDRCGAWQWQDGQASCTREVRRRYWHHRPWPDGGAKVAKLPGKTSEPQRSP